MPIPEAIARANRVLVNPVLGRLAGRVRPFALVEHVGRRSGRAHRTPVWAFPDDGRWWIALTYGPDRDWVRNVEAAGGCTIEHADGRIDLVDPRRISIDEALPHLPRALHPALRALRVDAALVLVPVATSAG